MKELFTKEVYEAAQAYRHVPSYDQIKVRELYENMVKVIAKTAIAIHETPDPQSREERTKRRRVVENVFVYYVEKTGKSQVYTLTNHRLKKGLARLDNCLKKTKGNLAAAEELMRICIDTMAASAWHMGDNPQRKAYNDWENQLFSSESRMEKWLEEAQR